MLAFTEKVTLAAHEITRDDVEELRRHGFSDAEVLDVAMTAGARSFFSKVLDAVGAEPERRYDALLEEGLRATLTVGRPVSESPKANGTGIAPPVPAGKTNTD